MKRGKLLLALLAAALICHVPIQAWDGKHAEPVNAPAEELAAPSGTPEPDGSTLENGTEEEPGSEPSQEEPDDAYLPTEIPAPTPDSGPERQPEPAVQLSAQPDTAQRAVAEIQGRLTAYTDQTYEYIAGLAEDTAPEDWVCTPYGKQSDGSYRASALPLPSFLVDEGLWAYSIQPFDPREQVSDLVYWKSEQLPQELEALRGPLSALLGADSDALDDSCQQAASLSNQIQIGLREQQALPCAKSFRQTIYKMDSPLLSALIGLDDLAAGYAGQEELPQAFWAEAEALEHQGMEAIDQCKADCMAQYTLSEDLVLIRGEDVAQYVKQQAVWHVIRQEEPNQAFYFAFLSGGNPGQWGLSPDDLAQAQSIDQALLDQCREMVAACQDAQAPSAQIAPIPPVELEPQADIYRSTPLTIQAELTGYPAQTESVSVAIDQEQLDQNGLRAVSAETGEPLPDRSPLSASFYLESSMPLEQPVRLDVSLWGQAGDSGRELTLYAQEPGELRDSDLLSALPVRELLLGQAEMTISPTAPHAELMLTGVPAGGAMTLSCLDSQQARQGVGGADGRLSFPGLPAGRYQLEWQGIARSGHPKALDRLWYFVVELEGGEAKLYQSDQDFISRTLVTGPLDLGLAAPHEPSPPSGQEDREDRDDSEVPDPNPLVSTTVPELPIAGPPPVQVDAPQGENGDFAVLEQEPLPYEPAVAEAAPDLPKTGGIRAPALLKAGLLLLLSGILIKRK